MAEVSALLSAVLANEVIVYCIQGVLCVYIYCGGCWQYDANDLPVQQSQQHYGLVGPSSMYDPRATHHSPTYPPSVGVCGVAPGGGPMSYGPPGPAGSGYPPGLVGGGTSPDGQLKRDKDAVYG